MHISFALKNLLTPMLTLLFLAGCVPPAGAPDAIGRAGDLRVALTLPTSGYQAQYLAQDISLLVVGLMDVSTTETPTLGYENSDKGTAPAYHAAIVGQAGAGNTHDPGLLDLSAHNSLTTPQKIDYSRVLYRALAPADGIGATRNVTFKNLPAGDGRYIVFAAAFTGTGRTMNDIIGFDQSVPFNIRGDALATTVNVAPPLELELNRGLASYKITLTFNETQKKLADTDKLVVSLVDVDTNRTAYFGYEGATELTADPPYHTALVSLFDYTGTSLTETQKNDRRRRLHYTAFKNGFLDPAPARIIRFSGLKPGGNYVLQAVAFTNVTDPAVDSASEASGRGQWGLPDLDRGETEEVTVELVLQ